MCTIHKENFFKFSFRETITKWIDVDLQSDGFMETGIRWDMFQVSLCILESCMIIGLLLIG